MPSNASDSATGAGIQQLDAGVTQGRPGGRRLRRPVKPRSTGALEAAVLLRGSFDFPRPGLALGLIANHLNRDDREASYAPAIAAKPPEGQEILRCGTYRIVGKGNGERKRQPVGRPGKPAGKPQKAGAKTTTPQLPEWEQLLRAAAHLQRIVPDATLVGGTAAAITAEHRLSLDADHVLAGMRDRYDEVLAELQSAAGWRTDRIQRPVLVHGNLDGVLTSARNLIRTAPLDTTEVETPYGVIRLPTPPQMLRVKAYLIVKRNATRDFLDVAALSHHLGPAESVRALPRPHLSPRGRQGGRPPTAHASTGCTDARARRLRTP